MTRRLLNPTCPLITWMRDPIRKSWSRIIPITSWETIAARPMTAANSAPSCAVTFTAKPCLDTGRWRSSESCAKVAISNQPPANQQLKKRSQLYARLIQQEQTQEQGHSSHKMVDETPEEILHVYQPEGRIDPALRPQTAGQRHCSAADACHPP